MNEKRHFFISPHPDDVIWSCGGRVAQLIQQGQKVAVLTIFDQYPEIVPNSNSWQKIVAPEIRKQENLDAMEYLGIEHISLNFMDAAFRIENDQYLYASSEALFDNIANSDKNLPQKIYKKIELYFKNVASLNFPLGSSQHVDHRIIYATSKFFSHYPTYWYEEFPYSLSINYQIPPNLKPSWHPVDFSMWQNASLFYESQILNLFNKISLFKLMLQRYAKHRGNQCGLMYAERYWVEKNAKK